MTLKILFLTIFLAGLALAVNSMLHGAERWRLKRSTKPSAFLNPPTVAALAIGFGACGYLLVTRTHLGPIAILAISAASALGAVTGMIVLMAKWALRGSSGGLSGEDEEVHGQIATVSRTITSDELGEIAYFAWDTKHALPARSLDGSVIPEGAEVVVDIVDDGVASVELWSVVEQRL